MKNSVTISCVINTTDSSVPLGLEIWLDNEQISNYHAVENCQTFEYNLADDEAEHELRFVMKNKTVDHTEINDTGDIVKDACLTIDDVCFDQIKLGHTFQEKAVYTHDFNGTDQLQQHKFYGTMGCNGTVSLKFTTPMYLWLLENM
jgi:hypothetical protein